MDIWLYEWKTHLNSEQTEVTIPEQTNRIDLINTWEEDKENDCHIPINWKFGFYSVGLSLISRTEQYTEQQLSGSLMRKIKEIYGNNILIVWDNIKRLDYGKVAPPKTNSFYFGSRIMKNNCKNN